jgi:hypothetical protein
MCQLSTNLGASTSWSPKGLPRPVMGLLYLLPTTLRTVKTAVDEMLFQEKCLIFTFMKENPTKCRIK